jgi:hypothetical protein
MEWNKPPTCKYSKILLIKMQENSNFLIPLEILPQTHWPSTPWTLAKIWDPHNHVNLYSGSSIDLKEASTANSSESFRLTADSVFYFIIFILFIVYVNLQCNSKNKIKLHYNLLKILLLIFLIGYKKPFFIFSSLFFK